jgi:tripartite-type tricarboxylate transporter receptor subunit TctC
MFRLLLSVGGAAVLIAVSGFGVAAQEPDGFYKSRSIRLIVGYEAGGGYDTYARLLARHYGRNIAGSPSVIVENMPGAGSVRATNWIYNVAPKDGTALAITSKSMAAYQLLGGKEAKWDSTAINWIGRIEGSNGILYTWHRSGIRTLEDAKTRSVKAGSTGRSTDSYIYPVLVNALLGTKFDVIVGYGGGSQSLHLAMERGEIDARAGNTWASLKTTNADWIKEGKVHILFQVGLEKEADLQQVPLLDEFLTTPEQRQLLAVVALPTVIGYSVMAPPAIPEARLASLRAAFQATQKDAGFIAEADKQNLSLTPAAGEDIARHVREIAATPQSVVAKAADMLGWTK